VETPAGGPVFVRGSFCHCAQLYVDICTDAPACLKKRSLSLLVALKRLLTLWRRHTAWRFIIYEAPRHEPRFRGQFSWPATSSSRSMLTSLRQLAFLGGIDLIVPWEVSEILYGYPSPPLNETQPLSSLRRTGWLGLYLKGPGEILTKKCKCHAIVSMDAGRTWEAKIVRWRQLTSIRPFVLSRFATETSIRGHPRQLKHLQRMRYVALNSASLSLLMWLCYRLPTTLLLLISPSFTVIEDPPMACKRLLGSVVKAASLSRCVQVIMF
jgi:hypothetical protein